MIGAGFTAVLASVSLKKRHKILETMDAVMEPSGLIHTVEAIRGPTEDVRENFRLACAWWWTFRPIILAEAERFAGD